MTANTMTTTVAAWHPCLYLMVRGSIWLYISSLSALHSLLSLSRLLFDFICILCTVFTEMGGLGALRESTIHRGKFKSCYCESQACSAIAGYFTNSCKHEFRIRRIHVRRGTTVYSWAPLNLKVTSLRVSCTAKFILGE